MRQLLLLLLLALAAHPCFLFGQDAPANAPTSDAQQAAYQESISQEAVRKQADKIRAEIAALLADAKLNGLDTTQLSDLSAASNNLGDLSRGDMEKVVSALQSASAISADQARRQVLVKALEEQKAISLKLKSLAVSLAAQESEKELPLRLQALVMRQSANLRQTRALSSAAENQQKSAHDVVSSEQSTIGGEIGILSKALSATPNPPAAPGGFNLAKAVLDAMNTTGLISAAASATDATKSGAPADGLPKQAAVRDGLITALIAALANADAANRLNDLKSQVHQLYSNEKNLAATTSQSGTDAATLADQQFQVSDSTLVVTALLKPVSAAASTEAGNARQAMDDSAQSLQTAGGASAAAKQQTALDALKKAESLLDEQILAAKKEQQASPADKLAQLQQLSKEIEQARKNSAETPSDLQKLQQEALAPSPQAAAKIGDAASRLNQPQPDTAGANAALAQAQAAIQQQTAALQQAAQAYAALEQAKQQLAQSQQQAAAAQQALQQNNNNNAAAARNLTQAQANLNQMNQTPPAGGLPQAAQQAMQQAANALQQAAMQAVQGQNASAQGQTQNAQNAMQQAQAALGQAMAQIQQQAQGGQGPQGQAQAGQQMPTQIQPGQAKDGEAPMESNAVLGGSGTGGIGQVVGGLQPKDRDAIKQFQAEKSPPEYSRWCSST